MKSTKEFATKMAKAAAESALKRNANSTTCGAFYQPKAPANLERFKNKQK